MAEELKPVAWRRALNDAPTGWFDVTLDAERAELWRTMFNVVEPLYPALHPTPSLVERLIEPVLSDLADLDGMELAEAWMHRAEAATAELERVTRERDEARAGRKLMSSQGSDTSLMFMEAQAERDALTAELALARKALELRDANTDATIIAMPSRYGALVMRSEVIEALNECRRIAALAQEKKP